MNIPVLPASVQGNTEDRHPFVICRGAAGHLSNLDKEKQQVHCF